jgi:hypothetical protein
VEELSEIFQRWRQYHLIVRAHRQLENRNSNELTDDLGINSDSMPKSSGLKHQPVVIVLHHLEVGIEKSNQPGVHYTGAAVKIPPMIGLDSVMDTIQRSHHNIITDHYFCSESCPISLCPLANSAMWAACGLDSAKETNKIYQIIQKK